MQLGLIGLGKMGGNMRERLRRAGHEVVGFDNLCNSSARAIERVEAVAGRTMRFERLDLRDSEGLARLLSEGFDVVMHFAGLKAVGESVEKPQLYFDNNVGGT